MICYLSVHKLHKQQGKDNFKHPGREFDKRKTGTAAHIVVGGDNETPSMTPARVGSSFTPAQFVEILQLLGGNTLYLSNTNAANMAGHTSECNVTYWIIDTRDNEHMTGPQKWDANLDG